MSRTEPSRTTPEGFERVDVNGVQLVAATSLTTQLTDVLRTSPTLYDWAAEQPQPRALRGRAPVYVASLPTGDSIAVRHAWHGGAFAPLTRDLWITPSRAPQELRKSLALVRGGVPTAPLLGYALYPALPGFVRVDVVSKFIDDTYDLGAVLLGLAAGLRMEQAAAATRVLLVTLAAQQLVHPDLNVKNILLQKCASASAPVQQSADSARALVIDVDTMRHRTDMSREQVAVANMERLSRSLHKWRRQTDATFDVQQIIGLLIMSSPGDDAELPRIIGFDD